MESSLHVHFRFQYDRFLLLLPFLMWCLLPVLSYNLLARLLVVLSLGMFFLLNLLDFYGKRRYTIKRITLVIGFILIYMSITNFYFSSSEYTLRHLHFSMFIIFIVVSFQAMSANVNSARLIVALVFIANIVTLILTINALNLDHNVARYLVKSNDLSRELTSSGLGGYGVVYANVVMLPVLLMFLKFFMGGRRKSLAMLTLCVSNIMLSILLLIKAQYSIALLTGIFIVGAFSFQYLNKYIFIFLIFFVAIVTPVLFSPFTSDLNELVGVFEGTTYQSKITDLISATSGGNKAGGPVDSRAEKYTLSFVTFLGSPIWGVLGFGGDIGQHSDIVDKFAQWGAVIGVFIVYILTYFPLKMYKLLGLEYKVEVLLVLFALLVVGLFNTIPMEMSVPFILLSCFYVIKKQNDHLIQRSL